MGDRSHEDKVVIVYKPLDDQASWLARMLDTPFQHCFILKGNDEYTVEMKVTDSGMAVYLHKIDILQATWQMAHKKGYCVQIVTPIENNRMKLFQLIHSCVNMCKDMVGVHAWWIQTPYQLYMHIKTLKKEGKI